ncbi:MAG: Mov34/MPN/PAD-1 family protein, partial [Candidatus Helarchaeales archaeon]
MKRGKFARVSPLAFHEMIEHASSSQNKEVGGFLIGRMEKECLVITDVETGRQVATGTHVMINDLEMARIAEELHRFSPDKFIIGWYHSHPGMGSHFFSHTDVSTQKRYQALFKNAVGIVIDPVKYMKTG